MNPGRRPIIDFDGDAVKLVRDCYSAAENVQQARWDQAERDWLTYLAYIDMAERDPDMPNVALPKIYSLIETKTPDVVSALFGRSPMFPIHSRRREFRPVTDVYAEWLDYLSGKGRLYEKGSMLAKLAVLYGTSYIEPIPWFERVVEKKLVKANVGGFQVKEEQAYRLRLKFETYALWDVLVDPIAKSLSDPTECRYVVIPHLTSKRNIKKLYAMGAYPGLDIELLDKQRGGQVHSQGELFGQRMLNAYGLSTPLEDDDIGVLLRFQSPDRYCDVWMGETVLRDGPNPYDPLKGGHGKINLSKLINVQAPHTSHEFFGIGEAKPNEILQAILNDTFNLTLATHQMLAQPLIFFRKEPINKSDLVFAAGQRIPVDSDSDRPISDSIMIHGGTPLPPDHYAIPDRLERFIDLGSGEFGPARGETLRGGSNTASEAIIATEKGSKRQEGMLMLDEASFKVDLGEKCFAHMGQFGQFNDIAEVVGEARAMLAYTSNPMDLPGGYNFEYSGSARVRQRQMQFERLNMLAPVLQQSIAARPGALERKLLDLADLSKDETDDILLTPEEVDMRIKQEMMMQQQQQEQEQAQQAQEADKGRKHEGEQADKDRSHQLRLEKEKQKGKPKGNAYTNRAKASVR